MAEYDVLTGHDTWVRASEPTANNATGRYPKLKSGEYRTLLYMPLGASRLSGKTILSATLSCAVQSGWVAQTVTVQALAESWNLTRVNWNNQPGVTGATATEVTGALASGDRFEVDVTALVQAIADGQAFYGWRLSTSQATDVSALRGFDSGVASWTLNVEVSDLPPTPSQLSPAGVISIDKPVVMVDETDDMAQIQVQVDANATSPFDFDSGWVATTAPLLDLADTAYAGLADGASTYWRARIKLTDGAQSAWSSWVQITRHVKPSLVMDNPSGSDVWDPTPTIAAHLSPAGDADTRWQVYVTALADPTDVLYNSGDALTGADLDHKIPLRWQNHPVLVDDGDYRLVVKAWDRADRVPSTGDPTFVRTVTNITVDYDAAVTAPTDLVVTQLTSGYPEVVLTWERASDPDWFVVRRDGKHLATVDVDDYRIDPGVWQWVDETAEPNVEHTYAVRAVTTVAGTKKQSANSNIETIFTTVDGVWLRCELGDVLLEGDEIGDFHQVDKRQTFTLPYRGEDVDIVTAVGGFEGTFSGGIDSREDRDVDAARVILEQLRNRPHIAVRLVWATQNRWVHLRGLSVSPHPQIFPDQDRLHTVAFGFFEIEPRD